MKRNIIMMFLLTLCTSVEAQTTHAHTSCDEDSINPKMEAIISEITVSGLTGQQRLKDSSIPFTVILPRKQHQTIGMNIVDMIAHTPGISQITTGSSISKPVIRGLGYNRVVVIEQGIRQEGQQWGDEHGLEVDANGVHSVEILKGPASLMYGSDAMAGVIIFHPEPNTAEGVKQIKAGGEYHSNNGLYNYRLGIAGNNNGLIYRADYSRKASHCYTNKRDGYVPGTWANEYDTQILLGLNRTWGHTWLRGTMFNFTPGITEGEMAGSDESEPESYHKELPFQRVLHYKAVSDNLLYLANGTIKAIIGYQQNYRREYEEEEDEAELAMRLHTVNYDLRLTKNITSQWDIATGINGMRQCNKNQGDEQLIPDYKLTDIGVFFTFNKKTEYWSLAGGVRIDNRHQEKKNYLGISGNIGAVCNITEKANMRFNAARGFRAPTMSELASDGVHEGSMQYEIGNHELEAEYSTQLDLGMDYTSHYASVNLAIFANRIDNYIFLSRLPYVTEGLRTYQYRQGTASVYGGEITVDIHPINALHIENAFSIARGIQLHQPSISRNLPMMPAPRWNCDVRYDITDLANHHIQRPFISLGIEYNMRQDHYYKLDNTETATSDYTLLNASIGVDLHLIGNNCIEIVINGQNLTDKAYQPHLSRLKYVDTNKEHPGLSAMGRNIAIKISMPIELH